jgi:hypothetical protein
MERGDDLVRQMRGLSRRDFEQKYQHLWLIRELHPDERSAPTFATTADRTRAGLDLLARTRGNTHLGARLRFDPSRYGLYPIAKRDGSLWADRILLGRASNNDIVIRDPSISKLHAYFRTDENGATWLHDANSSNGTRIDGQALDPSGPGAMVRTGSRLVLGSVATELIGSTELHLALVS